MWSIPGGAQELGETAEEAAIREIREETDLEINILGLVDVVDVIRRDIEGKVEYHYTCLLYTSPSPRDVEESRMPSSA